MSASRGAPHQSRRYPARASRRLRTLAIAAFGLVALSELPAVPAGAEEPARSILPRALVEARSVFLMASPFSSLREHFEEELGEWGRLKLVEFPTEADAIVSLGTTHGFVRLPVGEECGDAADDPLCSRPVATTPVFDAFRIEIFVQGGETLWRDEVAVEHDDRAARIFVERLRERIEESGGADSVEP